MPVPSPATSASGNRAATSGYGPTAFDPLAADRDGTVPHLPGRPGGEHVPGPDEEGARGRPRAPRLAGHVTSRTVVSPMDGLMYSLV